MPKEFISYKESNYFSSMICDYLDEKQELKALYNRFPKLENFKDQITERSLSYNGNFRKILVNVLKDQYANLETSDLTQKNIEALDNKSTFTVTTGHQLNLFTGPLYFLYKIISTINLTHQLKTKYPECNFVPIYWMATEDHDFDEINYFNLHGKKVQWTRAASGAVGRLGTNGLRQVYKVFSKEIGLGAYSHKLKELFEKSYLEHDNLSEATRFLANELFKSLGLVILDGDDERLKRLFMPKIEEELLENTAFKKVTTTNVELQKLGYPIQVNPREINLFYLKDELRERIIYQNDSFKVFGTKIEWTKDELINEVSENPERFSPNALLRPLYQEVVLPNLCYIGGGGELAYWLQLKDYFEATKVPFPMLLLRNSVLIRTSKQSAKQLKLELSNKDIFLNQQQLIEKKTISLSKIDIDFSTQKEYLKNQFESLYKLAEQTDGSFLGAVGAQERKQIKGLEHLEKRLRKAQKRKLASELERIIGLQNELFPGGSLQERNINFSELYLHFGDQLIQQLVLNLQPLKSEFLILNLDY